MIYLHASVAETKFQLQCHTLAIRLGITSLMIYNFNVSDCYILFVVVHRWDRQVTLYITVGFKILFMTILLVGMQTLIQHEATEHKTEL